MTTDTNTRGSEWRKWDLHVHTPESGLNNQFGSDWDSYVKNLFNSAIDNNISAIGITDYFTIDGYKKLKNDYLKKEDKLLELFENDKEKVQRIKSILVLPNIEFRLHTIVQKGSSKGRINYHVIFSNDVDETQIEENFLHEIDFTYESLPFEIRNSRKLKRLNIEELGEKLRETQPDDFRGSNFEVGCSVVSINNEDITKILNTHKDIFGGKYLIAIPVDEDLSAISWNGQDHMVRKSAYQEANMFFTSNEKTHDFGLGKCHPSTEDFIKEFKSFKPCIHGSDAHSIGQLFNPEHNRYCWIKAEPTFEGLKQLLYEPESRVHIQQQMPEQKVSYQLIDSIMLSKDLLWNGTIYLNQNLNTIIGGRATGKSTLLKAIAKKIDPNCNPNASDSEKKYIDDISKSISIIWKDGQGATERDIEFFSQGEMYNLANNRSELDNKIRTLIKDTETYKQIEIYEEYAQENNQTISQEILNLFQLQTEINKINIELREKGDKQGIITEISNLNQKINELSNGIGLSEEDIEKCKNDKQEIAELDKIIHKLDGDLSLLASLKDKIIVDSSYSDHFYNFSSNTKDRIAILFNRIRKRANLMWKRVLAREENRITRIRDSKSLEIHNIRETDRYKKYEESEKNNTELVAFQSKLSAENEKLQEIIKKEELLSNKESLKQQKIDKIISEHKTYKTKLSELSKEFIINHDNVIIKFNIYHKQNELKEFLELRFNQRGAERQKRIEELVNKYDNQIDEQCRNFLEQALLDKIEFKNSFTKDNVVREFFTTNWYSYSFELAYQGDTFELMSQGKQAFVVLKLLLEFSKKECPILIDQPEDSLDNRAIYKELVQYIRTKKTERQIILVTHNPNIVVGADAENVIVANQHGDKNENRDGYKFQYINGSLENITPIDENSNFVLEKKSVREHVCEILEGGEEAFQKREQKYNL